jgi:hypothetical protein
MLSHKIKIELELPPEIAFLVSTYLASATNGDSTLHKLLSETGINHIREVAQTMIDQVAAKTDFDSLRMRNTSHFLSNPDNNTPN